MGNIRTILQCLKGSQRPKREHILQIQPRSQISVVPFRAVSQFSAVPVSALPQFNSISAVHQFSAVIIACHDLARSKENYCTALYWDSAGSHFSAGMVVWQGNALLTDHDCIQTGMDREEL